MGYDQVIWKKDIPRKCENFVQMPSPTELLQLVSWRVDKLYFVGYSYSNSPFPMDYYWRMEVKFCSFVYLKNKISFHAYLVDLTKNVKLRIP